MRHPHLSALIIATLTLAPYGFGALTPQAINRSQTKIFHKEGIYFGGSNQAANLASIRMGKHPDSERWVLDFADVKTKQVGKIAPPYQVRYVPAQRAALPDGSLGVIRAARFQIDFLNIRENYLDKKKVEALIKRSDYVTDVVVYPQVEGGDLSMEIVLNEDVLFEAHQPIDASGRLVLDLKKIEFSDIPTQS